MRHVHDICCVPVYVTLHITFDASIYYTKMLTDSLTHQRPSQTTDIFGACSFWDEVTYIGILEIRPQRGEMDP